MGSDYNGEEASFPRSHFAVRKNTDMGTLTLNLIVRAFYHIKGEKGPGGKPSKRTPAREHIIKNLQKPSIPESQKESAVLNTWK